ncbi:Flp pilus assembly protein CpaB [Spirillospora sp. CA-253888]
MRRRLLALAAALVLAVAGAAAIVVHVAGADDRALAGKRAVHVLVAARRVPAGTTGAALRTGDHLRRVRMPAETVPAEALDALDAGADALALTAELQPQQLLLRGMLARPRASTGGLDVPDGRIAVSVAVAAPGDVAGHVRPGTRIAVFDTFNVQAGRPGVPTGDRLADDRATNRATRVLLPRVQVLAVGSRPATTGDGGSGDESGGGSGGKAGQTLPITVAVTQSEAERLVHAAQTGTLYLGLLTDSSDVRPGAGVDNRTLFG